MLNVAAALAASVLFAAAPFAQAISSTGSQVLVVLESKLNRDDYSQFFNGLQERGFNLTFRAPKDVEPAVSQYVVPSFDHVVLFTPTTKTLAQDLSSQSIVSLLSAESPVNFIIALGPSSSQLSTLASEFNLSIPPPNTPLISHFPARSTPHTTLSIPLSSSPIISSNVKNPIAYSGIGFYPGNNPLLVPILNAPPEAFAADVNSGEEVDSASGMQALVDAADKGGEGLWAGSELSVVSGFVSKAGARVVWAGGISLFSDEFAQAKVHNSGYSSELVPSGNAQFVNDISDWAFQSSLKLRIVEAKHYVSGDKSQTQLDKYTVNTQVRVDVHVEWWHPVKGEWTSSGRPLDDLQLEFTMLDPHIRIALTPVTRMVGWYTVSFRVPDRHGVFKFLVDWRRKGYSHLFYSNTVSIVPKRHDEYPRFISAAWPYYAGALSTSLGFVVFSIIYLGGEVDRKAKGKSKSVKNE